MTSSRDLLNQHVVNEFLTLYITSNNQKTSTYLGYLGNFFCKYTGSTHAEERIQCCEQLKKEVAAASTPEAYIELFLKFGREGHKARVNNFYNKTSTCDETFSAARAYLYRQSTIYFPTITAIAVRRRRELIEKINDKATSNSKRLELSRDLIYLGGRAYLENLDENRIKEIFPEKYYEYVTDNIKKTRLPSSLQKDFDAIFILKHYKKSVEDFEKDVLKQYNLPSPLTYARAITKGLP